MPQTGPRDHFQRPPSSPPHSLSQRRPIIEDPCPHLGPYLPLPNSLPPTPPRNPFLSERTDSRFNQPFIFGFLSRTQPGLSQSCRGAFQSPVSMPVTPTPFSPSAVLSQCCSQPSSPSPAPFKSSPSTSCSAEELRVISQSFCLLFLLPTKIQRRSSVLAFACGTPGPQWALSLLLAESTIISSLTHSTPHKKPLSFPQRREHSPAFAI